MILLDSIGFYKVLKYTIGMKLNQICFLFTCRLISFCIFFFSVLMFDGFLSNTNIFGLSKKNMINSERQSIHQFDLEDITGTKMPLSQFKGKAILLVNVASRCGLTPQYKGLQALYKEYQNKGLVVIGVPANNFAQQEPGTNQEIKEFCDVNYAVTFPLSNKISVKGKDIHPLYNFLTKKEAGNKFSGSIKWNFSKFLINQDGLVVARYSPTSKPFSKKIIRDIEKVLNLKS